MSMDKKLLTAFALGEARGDDLERARLLVERDPEARKFVEEVKTFSKGAAEGLAKEPVPEGKGVAAIKAAIDARGKAAAAASPRKQYWVEGLVACTLLVAFVPQLRDPIMGFLKKGVQNSSHQDPNTGGEAMLSASPFSTGGGSGTGKLVKIVPEAHEKLFNVLGELDARAQQVQEVGRCKVQLPATTAKDTVAESEASLTHLYAVEKSLGGAIKMTVGAFNRKLFTWEAGEEFLKGRDYILVRKPMGDQPAVFYFVSQAAIDPVCGVQVTIEDLDFTAEDSIVAREALQNTAKKIAESTEFR